jgi:transposase
MFYVGIDIARDFNIVSIIDKSEMIIKKPFRVNNTLKAYEKFISKLQTISSKHSNFLLGLEATGVYGENLLAFLTNHGFSVKLLNPFQTKRYRERITMKKVKNDNIDSLMIAHFLKDGKFSSGYVTDDEYQSLRTLYRNRASLQSDIKEIKKRILTNISVTFLEFSSVDRILKLFRHIKGNNFSKDKAQRLLDAARFSTYSGKAYEARGIAIRSTIRLLRNYQNELLLLEEEIRSLLGKNKVLTSGKTEDTLKKSNTLVDNLKTIPGVSDKTIAAILSECGDITRFPTLTKFIGYLGLFPTENSSGNSKRIGHLSKRGSSLAKHALYMSSVSCLIHNDQLKQLYDIKRSQGKCKKEALVAVSRKLASIIYAIIRYNTPYDPARVFTVKS